MEEEEEEEVEEEAREVVERTKKEIMKEERALEKRNKKFLQEQFGSKSVRIESIAKAIRERLIESGERPSLGYLDMVDYVTRLVKQEDM
eukprot:3999201-Pleurochrysis_carterae.AAC.1